jgi:hypothetical protein
MSERKNVRKITRTPPMSFRFSVEFWEILQQKHGLKTGNDAANFFQKLYEQTFCPIAGVPTMERQDAQIGTNEVKTSTILPKPHKTTALPPVVIVPEKPKEAENKAPNALRDEILKKIELLKDKKKPVFVQISDLKWKRNIEREVQELENQLKQLDNE